MAPSEFLYLDTAPIDPSLITLKSGLTDELYYRSQLNLGFNSIQSELRLNEIQKLLKGLLGEGEDNQVTLGDISFVLESYLCTLLSTSSILNLSQTQQTSHFQRRQQIVPNNFLAVDKDYSETLLLSSAKTWGTSYGSLGYFLHLDKVTDSYLHPSQLTQQAIESLYKLSTGGVFEGCLKKLKDLALSDSVFDDLGLYKVQLDVLDASSGLRSAVQLLDFYGAWLPKVVSWYLSPYRLDKERVIEGQQELAASQVLTEVAKTCLLYGMDEGSFKDLTYRFIHQTIDPAFFSLFDDLLNVRKASELELDPNQKGELSSLVLKFFNSVRSFDRIEILRKASYDILTDLCPPGGYNLLLIGVAAALLNKALILTHITNNSYSNVSVFPLGFANPVILEFVGRVLRLIFLAGYTLKKSTLDSLSILGTNLITFSNLSDGEVKVDIKA